MSAFDPAPTVPANRFGVETDDYILSQIVDKSRAAGNGHFGVLSTGEKLAAALTLNRPDLLEKTGYTMAQAIHRLEGDWLSRIPAAADILEAEARDAEDN